MKYSLVEDLLHEAIKCRREGGYVGLIKEVRTRSSPIGPAEHDEGGSLCFFVSLFTVLNAMKSRQARVSLNKRR